MRWLYRLVAILAIAGLLAALGHHAGDKARPPSNVAAAQAGPTRSVVLAVQFDRKVHIFDATSLELLGTFAMNDLADGVEARPDDRMLFIRQSETAGGSRGCCASSRST